VDTPAGAYVLRVYRNTADAERVGYEHALLRALQGAGLPFAVPCPVPTPAGATAVPVPGDPGRPPALAALFPRLVGGPPDTRDLGQVRAAGAALGALHGALAGVVVAPPGAQATAVTLLGPDPAQPGAPVPAGDPLRLEGLPLAAGQRARLDALFDGLRAAAPPLYAALPRQVIHWDFEPTNVLMVDGRVAAVLDFEFATPDLRAMDVARGLHAWTRGALPGGRAWGAAGAFAAGYGERAALTPAEAAGVPTLLLLGQVAVFVHWAQRGRRGAVPAGAPADWLARSAAALLRLGDWLARSGADLTGRLPTAGGDRVTVVCGCTLTGCSPSACAAPIAPAAARARPPGGARPAERPPPRRPAGGGGGASSTTEKGLNP
jgi:homoserine kinase type II